MAYKYWGYITKHDDGTWKEKRTQDEMSNPIDPCKLSKEFKTKIAMMDFMKDNEELPCGSHKVRYDELKFIGYFIYILVSSAREDEKS